MKLTTILTFLIVAVVGSIGPASARVPQSEIHYSAAVVGGSVALTTDGGSLKTDGRRLFILDNSDGLVASIPLSYDRDSRTWPITAAIDSNTATLTPRAHPDSAATPAETPHDIAIDPQSDAFDNALVRFSTQINLAVTLGTLIGTVVGAGIGCLAGGSVGAAIGAVGTIGVLSIPGFLGGCLVTGAVGAGIGATVGTIVVGGPAAVIGGLLFLDALNRQNTN
ncbi:hypothetical protein [Nocardia terpenica]|uniref:hypothetical protein n=1 Tax=Nocardia terpenica TaxID=455432 RepID=UPI000A91D2BF|nr:hypothetical protein [Nocardia terpenica]